MDGDRDGGDAKAVEEREDSDVPCKDDSGERSGNTRLCSATAGEPQVSLLL